MSEVCPYCKEFTKPPQWIAEVAALRAERDAADIELGLASMRETDLRAEVERLRHALTGMEAGARHENWHLDCVLSKLLEVARVALEPKP